MANHKRKKSSRKASKCYCCSDSWRGNSKGRFKAKEEARKKQASSEIKTKGRS
jgi:hypothetical protein